MRRLTIGFAGTSSALGAIRQALEQYGHAVSEEGIDLLIEDGSQSLRDPADQLPVFSLRLGVGPLTEYGLPALQLRAYGPNGRLSAVLGITEEPSGNGQRLRQQVTHTLVEWVSLHVSGFSRDTGYFSVSAAANEWPEQGLDALDALAFVHRFNRTEDPVVMREAQVPVIEQLQASLRTFADRPALNIAGNTVIYRQLQLHALAIQQQLQPLLATGQAPTVVGVCLEKSIELYASILAVMGCAAVYLPLGPDHPVQRHQAMLESAQARVLLDAGQHPLRGRFTALDVSRVDPRNADVTRPLMQTRPLPTAPA